jgi:3-phosphoshikimate 1-carboxyvinyltransferase
MVRACQTLGATLVETADGIWEVEGVGHALPDECVLDAGNSGIVLRLLAAIGASTRRCIVDTSCPESLGRRGNYELIEALRQFGAECSGRGDEARPPLVVGRGNGLRGGKIAISGRRSSQFLSGLLFLSPLVGEDVEIEISDQLTSKSMVQMTLDTLTLAGIAVEQNAALTRFRIAGGQTYQAHTFSVPSDASSMAGLVTAVGAVPGSEVCVQGVAGNDMGTHAMLAALKQMGMSIEEKGNQLICRGAEVVQPIRLDGSTCQDSVLPMAALACFAHGTSTFYNVETLRFKECDRISDFRHELQAAGADVTEERDAIIIHGHGNVKGGTIVNGRHDHSVIMALAVVALRSKSGLTIQGAEAVSQTYPTFFKDLQKLGAAVEEHILS